MPAHKIPKKLLREAVKLYREHGSYRKAARYATNPSTGGIGIGKATFEHRLKTANDTLDKKVPENLADLIQGKIKRTPQSIKALAIKFEVDDNEIYTALDKLSNAGFNIHEVDGIISLEKTGPLAVETDNLPTYYSRKDNTYVFGAMGDTHIGSKYTRYDVLEDLYDRYAKAEVDRVFHAGNWIDGEFRFNIQDLEARGLHSQCKMLVDRYPKRKDITTYAITGDDHEGWYTAREGIDIGFYAERLMKDSGREDWIDMGYMEAFIRLVNINSGESTILTLVHPGGGSAYAISYSIQKIIESLDGGEKPAVGLYGHYHKLWSGNIRNVWCMQTGTVCDQTPFMRKNKLQAHVGGMLVSLEQDPHTGAIISCTPQMIRYFNEGYYNNRWNRHAAVTKGKRK